MSACSSEESSVSGDSENQKEEKDKDQEKEKEESQENKNKQEEKTGKTEKDKEKEEEEEEVASTAPAITEPKYKINQKNWSVQPLNESINEKVVLLTIDDAPDKYAVEMANTLKELDAGAIFFVNGHFLDTPEEKKKLKKIHDMGFMIGNHTYSHPFLPDISQEEQKEEILQLNNTVEEIIGEKPLFFRAPNGANTDYTKRLAHEEGMILMNWSYGYDYFEPYMDAKKLTEAMVTGKAPEIDITYSLLKPGANLLMHDREWTAKALKNIVLGLRDQGYEIVDPHAIKTK
ncbi:polysaccharide deacetylase [Virgibacillus necropolis]|uniref:Polysaccharide deacetylase n=2 Tax=Virgibacillus necropolis TaxID=163877 RepID=A0A221MIB5_9BACI|nr:polysaccharide deacetylase [Virgibacillus necropolis]